MSESEDESGVPEVKSAEDLARAFRDSGKPRKRGPGKKFQLNKLSPRHRMLATLLTNGVTLKAAASQVGCSYRTAIRLTQDPIFKEMLAKIEARIVEKTADDATSLVMDDAKDNVKFLKQTRDGQVQDDPRMLRERLKAAAILFDRQMPRKMEQKTESTHVIRIEGTMLAGFAKIVSEDDKGNKLPAIDAEYEQLPAPEEGEPDGGTGAGGSQ